MKVFSSKEALLPGSSYDEVIALARKEFHKIENLTKRQPYVRSSYFNKDKVFISLYWTHLMQLHRRDRTLRLKFYKAAIDLMRNTRHEPETIFKKDDLSIILHRFYGETKDGVGFCVQIKQDKRSGRKDFMSVFDRKSPAK